MSEGPDHEPVELVVNDLEFRDVLGEQYPHPLQSVVLPIIVSRRGVVHLLGTAFSIGNNLALTAHHVLTQDDRDIEEAAVLHVVPGPGPDQAHATLIQIDEVSAHPGLTDVSVLRLRPPPEGEHNPLPLRPMWLGMAPPNHGHPVAILGYSHVGAMSTVEEVLMLRPQLNVSGGIVVDHHPGGVGLIRGPCFQLDARADHQMSGGPVMAPAGNGSDRFVVRGVVSTGTAVPEGEPPLSMASMTFTALALAPNVDRGVREEPTYLYDLARRDRISVVDLDLVDWDFSDPTRPGIGLRTDGDPSS